MASSSEDNSYLLENDVVQIKRPRILDCFTKLSHKDEKIRLRNSVELLKYLANENNFDGESELKYAINRIIRGLGSSNEVTRSGYYAILVSLLCQNREITFEVIEECIEKSLKPSGNNPKGENADIYMGQLLVYGAIIRSKAFFRFKERQQRLILGQILVCSKKKSYLSLAAYIFFLDVINDVDESIFRNLVWPILKLGILKPWPEQNLDNLYLLISAKNKFPDTVDTNTLEENLGNSEILSGDSVGYLCNVLLEIPMNIYLKHPGYALVSQEIAKSEALVEFMLEIDCKISKPNRNKFLATAVILTNVIPNLKDLSVLPNLLRDNFMLQLQQNCKNLGPKNKADPEISEKVNELFEAITSAIKKDTVNDNARVDCLKKMLLYPGNLLFEKNTRSKIVQQITATLGAEGVKQLSKIYREIVAIKIEKETEKGKTSNWMNAERIYAAQMLSKLLSHPSVRNELDWKNEHLKFLLHYGLIKDKSTANVGAELAASLRDTFYRSLDLKFAKLEHLRSTLSSIVHHLQSLLLQENAADVFRVTLTTEALETWQRTVNMIEKLEKKSKQNKHTIIVFHTLFLHMSLQLFNEQKLAITSLQELFLCYGKVKQKRREKTIDLEDEDAMIDVNWIEVVVDLFLNLLSHNSQLLRKLIGCVFPHLCKYITPSAIHQVLAVLDPENESNPLSHLSESESSEEDEIGEESDKEDSEEGDDIDDEEHETVNEKLRTAVRQALGRDAQTDDESIDLDKMDEKEAEHIDKALSEAFKQFKPNKDRKSKKQNKEEQALTHFRVRALDLIEIYLDSEPPMLTCLEIMLPLLHAIEFCLRDDHQKPLQDRLLFCLKKLTSLKRFGSFEGINSTVLSDLMNSFLNKGTKSVVVAQEMADKISRCCVFIIKCSLNLSAAEETQKIKKKVEYKLVQILTKALESFFKTRDCMTSYTLFKNILEQNWSGILPLVPYLFACIFNNEIRPFRRSQALELLKVFYTNQRFLQSEKFKIQKRLHEDEQEFSENLIIFLLGLCNDPKQSSIREKYITNIFNLLAAVKGSPLDDNHFNWQEIGNLIKKYRTIATFSRDAKAAYNRLSQKLNLPKIDAKEERKQARILNQKKVEAGNKDKSKKIKKLSSKAKKVKKEVQIKRLQSNSEGLSDNFSFYNLHFTENTYFSNAEDEEDTLKEQASIKTIENANSEDERTFQNAERNNKMDLKPNTKLKHAVLQDIFEELSNNSSTNAQFSNNVFTTDTISAGNIGFDSTVFTESFKTTRTHQETFSKRIVEANLEQLKWNKSPHLQNDTTRIKYKQNYFQEKDVKYDEIDEVENDHQEKKKESEEDVNKRGELLKNLVTLTTNLDETSSKQKRNHKDDVSEGVVGKRVKNQKQLLSKGNYVEEYDDEDIEFKHKKIKEGLMSRKENNDQIGIEEHQQINNGSGEGREYRKKNKKNRKSSLNSSANKTVESPHKKKNRLRNTSEDIENANIMFDRDFNDKEIKNNDNDEDDNKNERNGENKEDIEENARTSINLNALENIIDTPQQKKKKKKKEFVNNIVKDNENRKISSTKEKIPEKKDFNTSNEEDSIYKEKEKKSEEDVKKNKNKSIKIDSSVDSLIEPPAKKKKKKSKDSNKILEESSNREEAPEIKNLEENTNENKLSNKIMKTKNETSEIQNETIVQEISVSDHHQIEEKEHRRKSKKNKDRQINISSSAENLMETPYKKKIKSANDIEFPVENKTKSRKQSLPREENFDGNAIESPVFDNETSKAKGDFNSQEEMKEVDSDEYEGERKRKKKSKKNKETNEQNEELTALSSVSDLGANETPQRNKIEIIENVDEVSAEKIERKKSLSSREDRGLKRAVSNDESDDDYQDTVTDIIESSWTSDGVVSNIESTGSAFKKQNIKSKKSLLNLNESSTVDAESDIISPEKEDSKQICNTSKKRIKREHH